jgi:adenosylhomocysteine nucleosidase
MSRIAFVAALEREVWPLVRRWESRVVEQGGRKYRIFENGDAVVVCAGIGAEAARRATEAIIQTANPWKVVSVGFAGALDSRLKVADVFEPRVVINSRDGSRSDGGSGEGTLVSSAAVADKATKAKLNQSYGASAVDMESAAVAQGAEARNVAFGALKAISDDAQFAMPAMDRFIAPDGRFLGMKFAIHVAVRPWMWPATIKLARNSSRASRALSAAMERYLEREKQHT